MHNLYLLHRGRIGGGKRGVGKAVFEDKYRGKWEAVEDGDRISKLALISSFSSSRFAEHISNFVHEVERIKTEATSKTGVKIPIAKFKDATFQTRK